MKKLIFTLLGVALFWGALPAHGEQPSKKVLVVVEGATSLSNLGMADGRQLATLLGHFDVTSKVIGDRDYRRGEIQAHDFLFYIGFHAAHTLPAELASDILATEKPVIWMNTGFREFSAQPAVRERFGFHVARFDSTSEFTSVRKGEEVFGKGEPNLNIVEITDRKKVLVLATARSAKTRREAPYIVRSGNLLYIGDSPFASAGEGDRYLLFADMLHDILGEPHEEMHSALIRIEDVSPMDDPGRLRHLADILSSRGIPFLVGVIPFYVNPGEGIRVSLSDKPDLVDALKYMVENGGTIVMHGVTHQYKGVTATDYEFWDENTEGPIRDETVEGIQRKLDLGIQEFMRNGLYPLIWETPHYTASFRLYQTVAKYFSSAMEQRLAIENVDYTQMFPYVIQHDLFGQRIYPEDLGYIPLDPDKDRSRESVQKLLANAKIGLAVRDGFASCFFHPFLDPDLLVELVEGIQALGYTYIDLREQPHWVKTRDRVILCGKGTYTVTLDDQYLSETWFERDGEVQRIELSENRLKGPVTRSIDLPPGGFYKAEPTEFRERRETFLEKFLHNAQKLVGRVFAGAEQWKEACPAVLWNPHALGSAYNDQASFVGALRSINLEVDTLFVGEPLDLRRYNLVIVPYACVDSLSEQDSDALVRFVEDGGALITDGKNDLAKEFGVQYGSAHLRVSRVRDRLFPDERIRWRNFELVTKFDAQDVDRVFCLDEVTEAPLVIGIRWGKGRVIYFNSLFDPFTQEGTSRYPYLLEDIRSYFRLGPVVRRDNLEVYFDAGFRRTISTEALIKQWVRQGVRILHVAAWHQYPKYTYDYARLVRLAHANGILVYAWLEPPQVSQKFWMEHPEWREKNYRGADIGRDFGPSWRYPVAMTDPRCLAAMVAEYRAFLERYDWDGVNFAELYFEAGRGFADPQYFTPMHPSAQEEFRKQYGFNLRSVLEPGSDHFWKVHPEAASSVVTYRVKTLEHIYRTLLDMAEEIRHGKPGFQIVVTALDSFGSPELREDLGVDMHSILALQKQYGFLLQVEDAEHLWSTDPQRYIKIGDRYTQYLGNRGALLLDLNILAFRKPEVVTPFPTLTQTGTESFQLVRSASLGAPRLTIYSESSVNAQDMLFFPYALASEVHYRRLEDGYSIQTPYSVVIKLPPGETEIRLDGSPLSPSRENLYLVPAGEHEIRLGADPGGAFSPHSLDTKILSMTGNLLSVSYGLRSVQARYESSTRALIALNREPTTVLVDGKEFASDAMKGNDCYTLFLPPGDHVVEIVAGDLFRYGIDLTSFWYTTAVALLGSLAVLSLLVMYLALKVVRRRLLAGEN